MAANSDAEYVFSADGPLGLTPTAGSDTGSGGGTGAAGTACAGEGAGALRTGLAAFAGVGAGVEGFLALGGLGGFPNSRTTFAASCFKSLAGKARQMGFIWRENAMFRL